MRNVACLSPLLLAACSAPMPVPEPAQDPARYETCKDADGQRAYAEALACLQGGREAAALPRLRETIERCPECVPAHRYYQETARHLGPDAVAAMEAYYRNLPDDPKSPVPAYMKAALQPIEYLRVEALDKLLAAYPGFAWGHLSLARVRRGLPIPQLAEAAESYRRALALHPGLLEAYVELAETLVELGQYEAALPCYENYLRAMPNDRATVRAVVQLLLYRLARQEAARPWIARLLAEDPEDVAALMDLAAADWRANRLEQALAGYLRALQLAPTNARAAIDIANMHYDAFGDDEPSRRTHWPKARKAYQLYLRCVRPEDGQDYFEKMLAVPYRLQEIDKLLGPDRGGPATIDDLR